MLKKKKKKEKKGGHLKKKKKKKVSNIGSCPQIPVIIIDYIVANIVLLFLKLRDKQ